MPLLAEQMLPEAAAQVPFGEFTRVAKDAGVLIMGYTYCTETQDGITVRTADDTDPTPEHNNDVMTPMATMDTSSAVTGSDGIPVWLVDNVK